MGDTMLILREWGTTIREHVLLYAAGRAFLRDKKVIHSERGAAILEYLALSAALLAFLLILYTYLKGEGGTQIAAVISRVMEAIGSP